MKKTKQEKKTREPKTLKTKSFQALMEKRLTTSEIAEIEHQAMLEAKALKSLQSNTTTTKTLDFKPMSKP